MRATRVSIAGLMGAVLVVSLALAALQSNSRVWSGATMLATFTVLGLAAVGAACRTGAARAGWLGFAVLGGGYLALLNRDQDLWFELPTTYALEALRPQLSIPKTNAGFGGSLMGPKVWFEVPYGPYLEIGHCLISLLLASIGGVVALALIGPREDRSGGVREGSGVQPPGRLRMQPLPLLFGLPGVALAFCALIVGLGLRPGVCVTLACTLTWALLGLAVVGAILGSGKRRRIWMGTAVFGIGYLALVSQVSGEPTSWPRSTVDRALSALRASFPSALAEFPPETDAAAVANERIRKALEQPIAMRFPNETPLEDVLEVIRLETKSANGVSIQIYVDPVELQESEHMMTSPITINLEGVPLKTSLRIALKQLGLGYSLVNGVLVISSEGRSYMPPRYDAFLTVGHCLMTWLAAVLGGILAPFVSDPHEATSE